MRHLIIVIIAGFGAFVLFAITMGGLSIVYAELNFEIVIYSAMGCGIGTGIGNGIVSFLKRNS